MEKVAKRMTVFSILLGVIQACLNMAASEFAFLPLVGYLFWSSNTFSSRYVPAERVMIHVTQGGNEIYHPDYQHVQWLDRNNNGFVDGMGFPDQNPKYLTVYLNGTYVKVHLDACKMITYPDSAIGLLILPPNVPLFRDIRAHIAYNAQHGNMPSHGEVIQPSTGGFTTRHHVKIGVRDQLFIDPGPNNNY